MSRRTLTSWTAAFSMLATFGCTRPSTWEAVESGSVVLAASDRNSVQELLDANSIPATDLPLVDRGAAAGQPRYLTIEGERITELALEGLRESPRIAGFPALEVLHLGGGFVTVEATDLPALRHLQVQGQDDRLAEVRLSGLPQLREAVIGGGRLQRFEAEDLPQLTSLALERLGIRQLPALPQSLTSLSLLANEVTDLSELRSLARLEHLDLGENGLQNVDTLPRLEQLRTLDLAGNPLSTDFALSAHNLPGLRSLDLRRTPLHSAPEGLAALVDLRVRFDSADQARRRFEAMLDRLRRNQKGAPGELVAGPEARSGQFRDTHGDCRWHTGVNQAARVRCSLNFARLEGLAAARLGTTDPAFPFRGGGAPTIEATLRVGSGRVWLYIPTEFDYLTLAAQVENYPLEKAESYRQPADRFQGSRRLLATPESPATVQGTPVLLGSRVLLWLEAIDGPAHDLHLDVRPAD